MKLTKLRNMFSRKASIIKEIINKVDALEACKSTCHKCTLKDEVRNDKEDVLWRIMKKDMENKEIMRLT